MQLVNQTDKRTIIVGLTGRIDSSVMAYLLKKQGYTVIGVSMVFFDPDEFVLDRKVKKEESQSSTDRKKVESNKIPFFGHCHISDLKAVRAFCFRLEIPFYAINAYEQYRQSILDPLLGAKLEGRDISACIKCNKLIVDLLYEKIDSLNATHIATGHFAKIQYNKVSRSYTLLSANDSKHDQSFELSGLKQNVLARLMLPLADMRKEEVLKIGESIGFEFIKKEAKKSFCLSKQSGVIEYVEKMAAKSLFKPGQILDYKDDTFIGEHTGVHNYYVGQVISSSAHQSVENEKIVVKIDVGHGVIYSASRSELAYSSILLTNVNMGESLDISKPLNGKVKIGFDLGLHNCLIQFKNNNSILIELEKERSGIYCTGTTVIIYTSSGRSLKIVGSGDILSVPSFLNLEAIKHKDDDDEDIEKPIVRAPDDLPF